MSTRLGSMLAAVACLVAVPLVAEAQAAPAAAPALVGFPILLGTTGACKSAGQLQPCTQTSTLVLLDPRNGRLLRTIGPVGYTVNGMAWDRSARRLYATTSAGDVKFHGLITINPLTGKGTPVNAAVANFGLPGTGSPIHSIAVDPAGHMVGWYDEFGPPGTTDTYVRINQRTGVAVEFGDTGINTNRNGLAFGEFNLLWNIDSPKAAADGTLTQNAYLINPFNGKAILSSALSPPTNAALGDFAPGTNLYFGLDFQTPDGLTTFLVVVDPIAGTITPLAQSVNDLHTIAFLP